MTTGLKEQVRDFWDMASCGEIYAQGDSAREQYETHARTRYELEPYIPAFAEFGMGAGKDVLEIGVGMGADHAEWAKSRPRSLTGIDLTPRAIAHTEARLQLLGYESHLRTGDAEHLPFDDASFDIVYSWGVLHHSPGTATAVREVHRVLRLGGTAKVMIYNRHSVLAVALWLRYGLLVGRPWRTLKEVYAEHLESPGTQGFTLRETRGMFSMFSSAHVEAGLSFGDLMQGGVGQRHRGRLLSIAKAVWPRALIRRFFQRWGTNMYITAVK
jgi:SAM-dependent methyltransferase